MKLWTQLVCSGVALFASANASAAAYRLHQSYTQWDAVDPWDDDQSYAQTRLGADKVVSCASTAAPGCKRYLVNAVLPINFDTGLPIYRLKYEQAWMFLDDDMISHHWYIPYHTARYPSHAFAWDTQRTEMCAGRSDDGTCAFYGVERTHRDHYELWSGFTVDIQIDYRRSSTATLQRYMVDFGYGVIG